MNIFIYTSILHIFTVSSLEYFFFFFFLLFFFLWKHRHRQKVEAAKKNQANVKYSMDSVADAGRLKQREVEAEHRKKTEEAVRNF